jgi:hypothetical protein
MSASSRKVKEYVIIEPKLTVKIVVKSTTPSGAAKKVYSKYIRQKGCINYVDHYIVKIQNKITSKIFEYEVHEVQKHDIVTRGNKDIPYTYNVIVKSKNIHKSEQVHKKKSRDRIKSKSRSKSRSRIRANSKSRSRKKICFFKKRIM